MERSSKRSPLAAVFLTVVIDLLGFGLVLPLLPLYAERYGAADWVVGLLFSSFSAMQFVFAPFWGRLSDRVGRRPILLVGLCGSFASYVLFALADVSSYPILLLFVSRIGAGVFGGTVTTALAYIADVTEHHERGRGMALIGAAFGIGLTVGPAIGGIGHQALGPLAPGLIAASFSAVAFAFAFFRLPEPVHHEPAPARGALGLTGFARARRIPGVARILFLVFVVTSAFAMLESTLALLAKDRFAGWNPARNGWLFSYVGLWLAVAQGWFVRKYLPRVGEVRFTQIGAVVLVVGLVVIPYASSVILLGAVIPLAVFGFAMMTPSLTSLLSQRAASNVQGEVLGVGESMRSLARIAGPAVGTALLGTDVRLPYGIAAVLIALTFVVARGLGTPGQPAPDAAGKATSA